MLKSFLDSLSLLTLRGYEAVVYSCLSDDTDKPSLEQLHDTIEGLLGCRKDTGQAEAFATFDKAISSRWTWKVVLKSLYVYHMLLKYEGTTVQWLSDFSERFSSGQNMHRFREGEGVDIQAESHSKIIRLYALYLRQLGANFVEAAKIRPRTLSADIRPLSKSEFLNLSSVVSSAHAQFKNPDIPYESVVPRDPLDDRDDDELVSQAKTLGLLCQAALKIFIKPGAESKRSMSLAIPLGFKELSTGVFVEVYRDITKYMTMSNIICATLIARAVTYQSIGDIVNLKLYISEWRYLAEQALLFTRFLQAMPELKVDLLPENPLVSERTRRGLSKLAKRSKISVGLTTPVDYSLDEDNVVPPESRATRKNQTQRRRRQHSTSRSSETTSEVSDFSLNSNPKAQALSSTTETDSSSSSESRSERRRRRRRRHSSRRQVESKRHTRRRRRRQPSSSSSSVSAEESVRDKRSSRKHRAFKDPQVGLLDLA
eukprot:Blabericola_migrator_1__10742@NODE_614_length_7277_cov_53_523024_g447_i0_p4_GENE_NODE_614_length_7277_cov_53_523024_g447_i0NODE_614_length_7277_cov_53_523024_g447_i0_p4_ORF_typecomplete_len485_score83_37ANTH/PF07651_16/8e08Rrn6/PF10214_9/1_7e05LAP1C/PF05609_12/0_01SOBP/PF15279_6/5_9_NODE_614_length_7277_cov_53_523024_g447_i015533007